MTRTIATAVLVVAAALLIYSANLAVDKNRPLAFQGYNGPVFAIAFAPDGRQIATGGADRTVRLWDAATGRERLKLVGHADGVHAIAFSPDGRTVASGGSDQVVRVWNSTYDHVILTLLLPQMPGGCSVRSLAYSNDGSFLAAVVNQSASDVALRVSGYAILWDAKTGKELGRLSATTALPHFCSLAYAPDGKTLGLAADGGIVLADVPTLRQRAFFAVPAGRGFWCLAFSPDGKTIATGESLSNRGKEVSSPVSIWDAATGQELNVLQGHASAVGSVAFAPEGRFLVSGGRDGTARLWDVRASREVGAQRIPRGSVYGVAFAPDGRHVAFCGDDGTVRLWDVAELVKAKPPE